MSAKNTSLNLCLPFEIRHRLGHPRSVVLRRHRIEVLLLLTGHRLTDSPVIYTTQTMMSRAHPGYHLARLRRRLNPLLLHRFDVAMILQRTLK